MAGITAAEAFDRLDNIANTKEAFISLLEEISLDSSGNKTVLYTGYSSKVPEDKALMLLVPPFPRWNGYINHKFKKNPINKINSCLHSISGEMERGKLENQIVQRNIK